MELPQLELPDWQTLQGWAQTGANMLENFVYNGLEWLSGNYVALLAATLTITLVQFYMKKYMENTGIKYFLDPKVFKAIPLVEKKYLTHNTLRLKFQLPEPDMRLGLPIGQHITFLAKDPEGKDVYRPYTPTSDDDLIGFVEFVIKVYPQGKMSQVLKNLKVGGTMQMKGPKGRFTYEENDKKYIGEYIHVDARHVHVLICAACRAGWLVINMWTSAVWQACWREALASLPCTRSPT